MFAVAAGNPFEGMSIFVSDNNKPFNTEAEAQAFGNQHFFDFQIIPVCTSQMLDESEDDEELDIIPIHPAFSLAPTQELCSAKSSRKSHTS